MLSFSETVVNNFFSLFTGPPQTQKSAARDYDVASDERPRNLVFHLLTNSILIVFRPGVTSYRSPDFVSSSYLSGISSFPTGGRSPRFTFSGILRMDTATR